MLQRSMNRVKKKKMPLETKAFIIFSCALPVIGWLVFYMYVNIDSFVMAFTDKSGVFTLENFVRFWEELREPNTVLRIAFKNTFLTFGINLLCFIPRVLVSYFLYKKVPGSKVFRVLFMIPAMVFSVALNMIVLRLLGVYGFVAQGVQEMLELDYVPELLADDRFANITVLLHMVWLGFPGDLIIWGGTFARIPEEVLESGKLDGVNWWTEFTQIIVPMVWPTVALQLVLTFCNVFGASGSVFLLTKGEFGTMTLSAWMYLQVYNMTVGHSNVFNYMSAVGMCLTVVAISISLIIRKYTDKAFGDVEF